MVVVMSIPAVSAMGKEASMQVLVRNSTHKIRTREPLRVSAVSYTHLDVYKRQVILAAILESLL